MDKIRCVFDWSPTGLTVWPWFDNDAVYNSNEIVDVDSSDEVPIYEGIIDVDSVDSSEEIVDNDTVYNSEEIDNDTVYNSEYAFLN